MVDRSLPGFVQFTLVEIHADEVVGIAGLPGSGLPEPADRLVAYAGPVPDAFGGATQIIVVRLDRVPVEQLPPQSERLVRGAALEQQVT